MESAYELSPLSLEKQFHDAVGIEPVREVIL
jgi:hypothetical protein